MKLNLPLLHRVVAQPWAIKRDSLRLFTRLILEGGDSLLNTSPVGGARTDMTALKTKRPARVKAGQYMPLNFESDYAEDNDSLPQLDDPEGGLYVVMPWGVLGRAWSVVEKMWLDAVDCDDMINAVAATPEGSTVVLWFRSPGGVISGIPEAAAQLRQLGKSRRLLAFTDDMCCSAAYWLAAQCSEIHATPTADLGSIGVYIAMYDYTDMMENSGISLELFKAGTMKAMGIAGNRLSDEESVFLQGQVDESYRAFTADVTANRAISPETMQGQSLRGKDALSANLADKFWPSSSAFFTALGKGRI